MVDDPPRFQRRRLVHSLVPGPGNLYMHKIRAAACITVVRHNRTLHRYSRQTHKANKIKNTVIFCF